MKTGAYEHKPMGLRVEMADRLTEFLAFELAGPNWAMYGVGAECQRQAHAILAVLEQWLPVGVEHRPQVPVRNADGEVIRVHPAEDRYVGAWSPHWSQLQWEEPAGEF